MVCNPDEAMSRYAQGDATTFEVVYEAVAPRLERFVRRRVREPARVEDIIQQTFLQMHAARGTFIVGAEVLPWAFKIAHRLMIDSGRRTRREERLDSVDESLSFNPAWVGCVPSGDQVLEAEEVRARLVAAYGRLSAPQRAALDLVKAQGISQARAASILGTTVTGIKLRVHRAYLALCAALVEGGDPDLAVDASSVGSPASTPRPTNSSSREEHR